jgi:hypothetical protein
VRRETRLEQGEEARIGGVKSGRRGEKRDGDRAGGGERRKKGGGL